MQKLSSNSALIMGIIEEVDIYKILLPAYQHHNFVRHQDDCFDELILSIKQYGLLNPIIVRTKNNRFEIVAGYKRYFACKKLGLRKLLCHIVEIGDKESFEISLVENIQRKNLSPMEEGKAFKTYVFDFGWGGMSDLSKKISKNVPYISKRIALLDLSEDILDKVNSSILTTSAAEELVFIKDKRIQSDIADYIDGNKITVAKIRKLIREKKYNQEMLVDDIDFHKKDTLEEIELRAQRSFDKTIITLKIAMNKIGNIINSVEDNWIVYEMLLQHKNMLNNQIDILIKQKNKIENC